MKMEVNLKRTCQLQQLFGDANVVDIVSNETFVFLFLFFITL